jgi:hypothetical protein
MSSEKKITLKPLKFEEAIADILKVSPPKPKSRKLKAKKKSSPKKAS